MHKLLTRFNHFQFLKFEIDFNLFMIFFMSAASKKSYCWKLAEEPFAIV